MFEQMWKCHHSHSFRRPSGICGAPGARGDHLERLPRRLGKSDERSLNIERNYPVVIITCVHVLGPPGPFYFPDSHDPLEVLGGPFLAERETPREDPLGSGRIP